MYVRGSTQFPNEMKDSLALVALTQQLRYWLLGFPDTALRWYIYFPALGSFQQAFPL